MLKKYICVLILFVAESQQGWFGSAEDSAEKKHDIEKGWEKVTYGSAISLGFVPEKGRLSLPGVFYGSGSGKKAVTLTKDTAAPSALWSVLPDQQIFKRGEPIKCGGEIRLKMPDEGLFLGSGSDHRSPLSENQEVSGVAEHEIGNVWKVECSKKDEFWVRDTPIKLVHKDTGAYLQAIPGKVFGAPIDGNLEVSCSKNPKSSNHEWAVMEGFFFKEQ